MLPGLEEPQAEAWRVLGGVWMTSAIGFDTGASVGLGAARRRLAGGPFSAGARLGWSSADEASSAWQLRRDHGVVAATAGIERVTQVARFSASLGVGVLVMRGQATRHQANRLEGLGITDLARVGWTAGPWTSLDFSLALQVRSGFCVFVSAGPFAAFSALDGASLAPRFGLQSMLGCIVRSSRTALALACGPLRLRRDPR